MLTSYSISNVRISLLIPLNYPLSYRRFRIC